MRNDIYRQLVNLIERHRTWIEVAAADRQEVATVVRYGTTYRTVCRCLVLEVFRANKIYEQHHRWSVSEFALDKALAAWRKQLREQGLAQKHSPLRLTPKDAEAIVQMATHGIVRLALTHEPLYTFVREPRI